MLGRFNNIIIMNMVCQLQSSVGKLLLRAAVLSADAPMLQGPSVLSKDCSNFLASHVPLFEHSLSFPLQHSLHRECINYHDRVVEVSSSFTRTPPGIPDTNTYPHSYTLIRQKFSPFASQPLTTDTL